MNKDEEEIVALDALKRVHDVVESIRASGAEAYEAMILMKTPCNKETMVLGMLLQASLSFSIALKQWIQLCEEEHAVIIKMNIKDGN